MPQDTRTQPVCAPHCTALSPDIRHDFQDEPLAVEHFGCVWRTYERRVRARVRQALAKLGLAALARRLDERSPGVRRPSTSVVSCTR